VHLAFFKAEYQNKPTNITFSITKCYDPKGSFGHFFMVYSILMTTKHPFTTTQKAVFF